MHTIFDIEQKQDSPEKLAAVADKETKYILFAGEFNDVARKAVESAIDDTVIPNYEGKTYTLTNANKAGFLEAYYAKLLLLSTPNFDL